MGIVSQLSNLPKANRVMGFDTSTKSLAFALIDSGDLVAYGKLHIEGDDNHEKIGDANRKAEALIKLYKPDFVGIESPIYLNNRQVVITLSSIYAQVVGEAQSRNIPTADTAPATWMSYIGNPTRYPKEDKKRVKEEYPDETKTFRKNTLRRWRKERTMEWVKDNYGVDITDDDVSDAVGVAHYMWEEETERG